MVARELATKMHLLISPSQLFAFLLCSALLCSALLFICLPYQNLPLTIRIHVYASIHISFLRFRGHKALQITLLMVPVLIVVVAFAAYIMLGNDQSFVTGGVSGVKALRDDDDAGGIKKV